MPQTIGYHLVKTAYGLWLPGDERGHWSSAWDQQIGYCQPHMLHEGDPIRRRMAAERMKHPPVTFNKHMLDAIASAVGRCVESSRGGLTVAAAAVEPTHMHLAIPYARRDIDKTAKWIADQTTKAVHHQTAHSGPVWAKGNWRSFVYDMKYWNNITAYIQRHNTAHNRPTNPYPWIAPS